MIDRIRLTATAKNQLITLKRRTGIQHYNALCRHALCISLENPTEIPNEELNFTGGLEIDWRTIAGESSNTLVNLTLVSSNAQAINDEQLKMLITSHIHRGLSYLLNFDEASLITMKKDK